MPWWEIEITLQQIFVVLLFPRILAVYLTFGILYGSEGVILIWIAQSESTRLYLEEAVGGGR
jgi:hypothetical protein